MVSNINKDAKRCKSKEVESTVFLIYLFHIPEDIDREGLKRTNYT